MRTNRADLAKSRAMSYALDIARRYLAEGRSYSTVNPDARTAAYDALGVVVHAAERGDTGIGRVTARRIVREAQT